jgi:hypothetical protein
MILRYGQGEDAQTAAQAASVTASAIVPAQHESEVNIWPFVLAGVISGLTVWTITRWLGGK